MCLLQNYEQYRKNACVHVDKSITAQHFTKNIHPEADVLLLPEDVMKPRCHAKSSSRQQPEFDKPTKPSGGKSAEPSGGKSAKLSGGKSTETSGGSSIKPSGGKSAEPSGGSSVKPSGG
jgi:hypothetical protein